MTRAEYFKRYGKLGLMMCAIPQGKMDHYHRYQVYKKYIAMGNNSVGALYLVANECCCEYITAYKSVSFFVNLRTKKEK